MRKLPLAVWSLAACSSSSSPSQDASIAIDATVDATPVDWAIAIDPDAGGAPLSPALLGEYDLSGALLHYDQQAQLPPLMRAAGMREWRVGVGRWEFGTQLLPSLTDGTACPTVPPFMRAPAGATDLSLIAARDWFTYTDGSPVTQAMLADDTRYKLDYVRSVIDVATAFGADAYVDIDHMPRALAANQTPARTNAEWQNACGITWTNKVSNTRPADPTIFAGAAVGLVRRIVEGTAGQAPRRVRYWEFGNEPELPYAWNPNVGDFNSYLVTAVLALRGLDAYRTQTTNTDGKAIRIGLGSFANAATAAAIVKDLDAPFDFVSFHAETHDDPLAVISDIESVAAARAASNHNHQTAELVLAEWHTTLDNSTLDPTKMDVALHHATVLALMPAAGITRAHHAIFWDFYPLPVSGLGIVNHDFTPKPAYYAFSLLAEAIGDGATRLAPTSAPSGRLESGMGAVLAAKSNNKVRVYLVNRNTTARTARIDLPTGAATPTRVRVFSDPTHAPVDATPSSVIELPPRSIALVEL